MFVVTCGGRSMDQIRHNSRILLLLQWSQISHSCSKASENRLCFLRQDVFNVSYAPTCLRSRFAASYFLSMHRKSFATRAAELRSFYASTKIRLWNATAYELMCLRFLLARFLRFREFTSPIFLVLPASEPTTAEWTAGSAACIFPVSRS